VKSAGSGIVSCGGIREFISDEMIFSIVDDVRMKDYSLRNFQLVEDLDSGIDKTGLKFDQKNLRMDTEMVLDQPIPILLSCSVL
jgi:hypothetical protein